jgi:hypothetical protein
MESGGGVPVWRCGEATINCGECGLLHTPHPPPVRTSSLFFSTSEKSAATSAGSGGGGGAPRGPLPCGVLPPPPPAAPAAPADGWKLFLKMGGWPGVGPAAAEERETSSRCCSFLVRASTSKSIVGSRRESIAPRPSPCQKKWIIHNRSKHQTATKKQPVNRILLEL